MLSFSLLGQAVLFKNGLPLARFRSQKEAALLVYLAHTRQTHQRDFIAELLWDATSTKQSLSNLRTALTRLRQQVGDDSLLITRKTLTLAPESQRQIDSVILLQTLTSIGSINSPEEAQTVEKALDTYHGDFLADFYLIDAPQFEEWRITTREHIRHQVIAAFHKLSNYALATEDFEWGIAVIRRWLGVDELNETAHMLLIRHLLKAGHRHEAVAHYDHCVALLQTELGVAPPAEMTGLIKDALPKPTVMPHQPAVVRHNLAAAHDQFFGRKAVQDEIHVRFDQPWCRLITITGPGGVGKTRLATTLARRRLSQYPDGAWLVELAEIDPDDDDLAEMIAVEIATILDLRLTGSKKPIEQLLDYLRHKQMMLILDNFEQLLAGVQTILDIVQECDTVQILVTSREALQLRAEWTIALTGLDYPSDEMDEIRSDAVDLFVARYAQQRHSLIAADDLAAIRRICHMVGGLPLAIELAAALTRHATVRAVADKLRDGFDALTTSLRDVPDRHRGLQVVFEMSWRTLTPTLQLALARLSVFRGGFMETAVQQIASVNAKHLTALIDKSLLTYQMEANRYTLHPVIRAYAAEKLPATDPTLQTHAQYFLTLLVQHTEPLQKNRPQDSIHILEPEIGNIRLAWQTSLAQRNAPLLYNALTPLSIYYQLRGLAREGETVTHTALRTAMAWGDKGSPLATRAGLEQVRFLNRLGHYRLAIRILKTTLKLAAQCNDRWTVGMGHVLWGESLWRLGEYDTAKEKLTHALNIAHSLGATLIIGWCHHQLGIICDIQSRYDTAHDHLEKACAAWRKLDNAQALSGSLNSLGLVCYHQGNLLHAQQAMEQALAICEQVSDRHRQANMINNLSIISTEQGDYLGAQYYLQLGLELAATNNDLSGQGAMHINLGKNLSFQDENDAAVEHLDKGLQILESIGERSMIAEAKITLAEVTWKQSNLKRAESLYVESLKIAQQNNLQRTECVALIGMAEILSDGDIKRAKRYSMKAIALAEAINNPTLLERAKTIDRTLSVSTNINEKNLSE